MEGFIFWAVVVLLSPMLACMSLMVLMFAGFLLIGPWWGAWSTWKHRHETWRGGGKF